jgi:hypothetical protein
LECERGMATLYIRLPSSLHDALHEAAKAVDLSLNRYVTRVLAQSIGFRAMPTRQDAYDSPEFTAAVLRVIESARSQNQEVSFGGRGV